MKKLNNRKGFTLIELLAVILILGIIALIAIPVVTGIITESRKGALKTSVQNIVKAIEQQCQIEQLTGREHTDVYDFYYDEVSPYLEVKGMPLLFGALLVDHECNVNGELYDESYIAIKEYDSDEVVISDYLSSSSLGEYTNDLLLNSDTYIYMNGRYISDRLDNNYVWFSGNLYRIMGKDENGNVRLISISSVGNLPYGSGEDGSNVFANSYAKEWLNDYFYSHLSNPDILQNTSYCATPINYSYLYDEIYEQSILPCRNRVNDTKITILSIPDYMLGEHRDVGTTTLTSVFSSDNEYYKIGLYGSPSPFDTESSVNIHPIITLPSNIEIISGAGTEENPLIIENLDGKTGRLIDNVTSGDYVSLEGKNYRVVEKISGTGTKIILDDAIGRETYTNMISNMSNNTYLSELGLATTDTRLVNYTWDKGNYFNHGDKYTISLAPSTNTFTSYVGGVKIGEIFNSIKYYYYDIILLNEASAELNWVANDSYYSYQEVDKNNTYSIRPAVVIAPDVTISGGNGTLQSPYEI